MLGWNLAISLICAYGGTVHRYFVLRGMTLQQTSTLSRCAFFSGGNVHVWKGASSTSLITVATMRIIADVLEANNLPAGEVRVDCGS